MRHRHGVGTCGTEGRFSSLCTGSLIVCCDIGGVLWGAWRLASSRFVYGTDGKNESCGLFDSSGDCRHCGGCGTADVLCALFRFGRHRGMDVRVGVGVSLRFGGQRCAMFESMGEVSGTPMGIATEGKKWYSFMGVKMI